MEEVLAAQPIGKAEGIADSTTEAVEKVEDIVVATAQSIEEEEEIVKVPVEEKAPVQEDMDLDTGFSDASLATGSVAEPTDRAEKPSANGGAKRGLDEEEDDDGKNATKKSRLERSMEEERLVKLEARKLGGENQQEEEIKGETESASKYIGPKVFSSSVEMFDYFCKFLHAWPVNLDINKYEQMVLLDLLKKGHSEYARKIGEGIRCFQVRHHPNWKSKCFFLLRIDGSIDDFSFRKCVDQILPLPDNYKLRSDASTFNDNRHGGHGRNRGGRRGRGRGGFRGR